MFNVGFKHISSSLIYPRKSNIEAIILSEAKFYGCYEKVPYGMFENRTDLRDNKFLKFEKVFYYDKNEVSECL